MVSTIIPVAGPRPSPQVGRHNEPNRVRWLEQTLQRIPAGQRILDAGAGELRFAPLCGHLQYVSQDFAQYDGAGDGAGLHSGRWDQSRLDLVCDIAAIPEPDRSFDAVMCIEVVEHIPNALAALDEFARLLRPGGSLVLTAPFVSFTHMAPHHYCTGFSRYFFQTHLEQRGLEIIEMQANGNYFEFLAQETRRLRSVARRYAASELLAEESAAIDAMLQTLQRLSTLDGGSDELLNFGYHVLARKVG